MITAYTCDGSRLRTVEAVSASQLRLAAWIDLISPTREEMGEVSEATGLELPTEADLVEIESSSRLNTSNGVLRLSMPFVVRTDDVPRLIAGCFVLSRDRLISIRFAPSHV